MSGIVQMPRYINVEVTGCIGMAAISFSHRHSRHKEIVYRDDSNFPPHSPREPSCVSMDGELGGELGDAVNCAGLSLYSSFGSMNEELKKCRGCLTSLQFSSKQYSRLKSARCAQMR
ncbi:hypothetical protein CRENBAI_005298 [Crenichthys baileyi]|uniref:Uncharacterized protein n=1 Tax=Crenichthys baileyi TaxID=28760 RepID=A0AAV9S1H9_9TELE